MRIPLHSASILVVLTLAAQPAVGGPRGSEFDLTLTPAAGGMEGIGIVRPQDPVAMLFGNPATLAQLDGKFAFLLGASYVSPDLHARHDGTNPFAGPAWEGRSRLLDIGAPHAAALTRLNDKIVGGFGFTAVSGLGSDFRNVAGAPNLVAELKIFGANLGVGIAVSERFHLGAAATIGLGALQVGAVENTASVNDFGMGGSVGFTYLLDKVGFGGSYKVPLSITYRNVVMTDNDVFSDFELEQPQELAFGFATRDDLWKNTFLEVDVRWKNWDDAEGYNGFWKDQYVYSFAVQHDFGRVQIRGGYSKGSDLAKDEEDLGNNIGTITQVFFPGVGPAPVNPLFIQLFQATLTDGYWQQSVSAGLGFELNENMRVDVNGNYAFDGDVRIGAFDVDGSIYSASFGLTWSFR